MNTFTQTSTVTVTPRVQISLLLLLGMVWFVQLGYRDLSDPDEGRYAEIPYEMYVSGDWITPRLNGFKYFEKPPLQYWGTAAFYHLFGVSNATSRLWCATLGFLGIVWTLWLGNRMFGRTVGYFAALTLGSGLLYAAMGHMNTLDMGLAFFLSVGMGALALAQTQRDDSHHVRRWMLVAWAALAGATLSKGLVGVLLPAATVFLYTLWQRDIALWRHMHMGKGLVLFFLLTAPWFIAVSVANPEFPEFFFIHEHFARYTSGVHGRTGHLLYFVPVFLAGALPWLTHALGALFKPSFTWRPGDSAFDPQRLMWVYVVFVLVFFSISNSKLIPYILPLFPPLALLMGVRLSRAPHMTRDAFIMAGVAVLLVIVGSVMVAYLPNDRNPPEAVANYRTWIFAAAGVLVISLAALYAVADDESREVGGRCFFCCHGIRSATILAVGSLICFQLIGWGYQSTNRVHSTRQLVEAMAPYTDGAPGSERSPGGTIPPTEEQPIDESDDVTVYCVGCFYHSLPFYRQGPVVISDFRGELELGIRQEPEKWIPNFSAFLARWQKESRAIAVLRREEVDNWKKQGMRMQVIYEDVARIAVIPPR